MHRDSLHQKMYFDPVKSRPEFWEHVRITAIEGRKVHQQIYNILMGREVDNSKLSASQKKKIERFQEWMRQYKPNLLVEPDRTIVSPELGYAGTPDIICRIGRRNVIVDVKTGGRIHRSGRLQTEGYGRLAEVEQGIGIDRTAILLLGNEKSEDGIRYSEIPRRPRLQEELDELKDRWNHMFPEPFGEIEQSEYRSQWANDQN